MTLLLGHTFAMFIDVLTMRTAATFDTLFLAGVFVLQILTGQGATVTALIIDLTQGTFDG